MPTDRLGDRDIVSESSFIIRRESIPFATQPTATLLDIISQAFHTAQAGQTRRVYDLQMHPAGQDTSDPVGLSVEATIDDEAQGLMFTSVNVFARKTVADSWQMSREHVAKTLDLFGGDKGIALDLRIKDNPFCMLSTTPLNDQSQSPNHIYRALRDRGASRYAAVKAVINEALCDLRGISPPLERTLAENNFRWVTTKISEREAKNVSYVLRELGIEYSINDGMFTVHPKQLAYHATKQAQVAAYKKAIELGFGVRLTSSKHLYGSNVTLCEGYTSEQDVRRTRDLFIRLEHNDIAVDITPEKVACIQQYVTEQFGPLRFAGASWTINQHTVNKFPYEMQERPTNVVRIV